MDPPRDPSPALLPWEVIERIISHSCDSGFPHRIHLESIRNFSLTSRELYPRSLCFLVAEPTFSSRDKIFAFCDFLQGKPHLKPSVRSITVDPNNFAPVPLLRILPHLPEIEFLQVLGRVNSTPTLTHPPAILHQSWLTCCRQLTVHTRILCLSSFSFATPLQFFQVLSAFSNIAHLTIRSGVSIKTEAGQVATPYVTVAQQRLSQRLRLLTLVIDDGHPEHYGSTPGRKRPHDEHRRIFAGGLLLSSGLVQSTAECLTVDISPKHRQGKRPVGIAQKLDPFRLRSLTLKLRPNLSHRMTFDIEFLKEFQRLSLKEVTVEVHCAEPRAVLSIAISPATHADFHEQLENAMLGFPQPKLVWVLFLHPMGRTSVCQWVQAFGRRFPTLFQRGALAVVPNEDFRTGHTCCVGTVAISPDSKWVASGSRDGTVVLRNDDGVLVQQWVAHDGSPSLAFSSDSQYLVSGATNGGAVAIWDLHGLGGVPRILEGHTDFAGVASCVCSSSPKGDVIAAGSRPPSWAVRGHSGSKRRVHGGGIVQLWDAHTFQRLHTLEPAAAGTGGDIASIEFSPDGRWLLAGFLPSSYYIWDVVLGAGRQLRVPVGGESSDILVTVVSAAFDPGSTRLAIVSPTGSVEILDVTDEEERCHVVLGASGDLGGETRAVAFSPNGDWVLTVPNKSVRTHAMRIWDARTGTADAKFQKHWESWFNQDDVDALVSNGINTVRIPVGYWIVERLVDRKTEFYPRGGILQLQRGLGQLKAAGISVILDHHALPGVQTALSSFAGYCTPDAQFYTPANYQRALTWTAVMTALSHLDSNFGSVFSIEAINEPIMDANKAPGFGDFEKNFVQTMRVMESILGIDSGSPVAGLPLNRTLPSTNFTTALTMVMSDSPDLHPQVRQAIRDSGPILMELSPSLGFGLPTGAPSVPLVMREPLVAGFMEMGWQHNNPPNPADAADGPAAYDGHLYYSYGGVADANEESYMYHICNTPGRARYDAAIGNSPLFFGEWSLSTNFDASDAFMRRWADAQKFVFSQTRGWIYWNFKMESSLPGSELRQWDYMEGVRRGYLTKDPSKFNDPNVCARYARKV